MLAEYPFLFFHFSSFAKILALSQISHLSLFFEFLFLWPIVSRPRGECIFWPSNQSVRRHKTSLFRLFTVRRFQKLQRSATQKKAEKNSRALKNTNGEKEEAFTRDFIFIYIVKNERHARRDDALFLCGNDPLRFFF